MNRSFAYAFVCLLSLTIVIYSLFERNPSFSLYNRTGSSSKKFESRLCISKNICKRSASDSYYRYVRDERFLETITSANGSKNAGKTQIPQIVHLTRFTRRQSFFRFHELISVLAAHSAAQSKIYVWVDIEPFGANWEKALKAVPDIYLIHRQEKLKEEIDLQRFSRKVRLEVVLEFGGIGLDSDILLLQPLTKFMTHTVTIGEISNIPSDDIVISKPRSPLLIKWFLEKRGKGRTRDPSKVFSDVATSHSRLVNIVPGLIKPSIKNLAFLYKEGKPKGIENIFCLKMWFSYHGVEHGPKELSWWNTTVGGLFRHFYYKVGKFKH